MLPAYAYVYKTVNKYCISAKYHAERRASGQHVLASYSAEMFTAQDILDQESAIMVMAEDGTAPHIVNGDGMKAHVGVLETSN